MATTMATGMVMHIQIILKKTNQGQVFFSTKKKYLLLQFKKSK